MDRETLAASAAGTAAELRVQLANMTAASQMLERTAQGEKAPAYLAVLNQSICRMLRTVGRMELLSRLTDEDEIRAFPSLTDLGLWAREQAGQRGEVLRGAGVSLDYQGPDRLTANVDLSLVQQLLLELVGIAAEPGGQVAVALAQRGDSACFTVRGGGTRLTPEELERMFDQERTVPGHWGLSLARQIAQLHGGSLVAETAPGECAALVAALPLRLSAPSDQLHSPPLPYDAGGFSPARIAFSGILPAESFLPERLN